MPEGWVIPAGAEPNFENLARLIGDGPVAVRSSGLAEDLDDASFAGMYETVLNVRGAAALRDAFRCCLESASGERAVRYRSLKADTGDARMGVLIQRMVAAGAAGVAFSANPVTGDREETLVSAVRGLGDRLASGEATPEEWVVRGGSAERRAVSEVAISDEQAVAIAELAHRVAVHLGRPQDIEWALEGGRVFLLQARPITTLDAAEVAPVAVEPPAGFWERDASHFPVPLSPVVRGWLLPEMNAMNRRIFADAGMLADMVEQVEIGGWVYNRLAPLGGEPPPLPRWLAALVFPLMARTVPVFRHRIARLVEVARRDSLWPLVARWRDELRPAWQARLAGLRDLDLSAMGSLDLAEHLVGARQLLLEGLELHFAIHLLDLVEPVKLLLFCRDHLGWEAGRSIEMLGGLSEMSTEPGRRLNELAHLARANTTVIELLHDIDHDTEQRIGSAAPVLGAALDDYQRTYGCRALAMEVMQPTLAECPELTLGLLRDQLLRAYDPEAEAAEAARRRAAAARTAREALAAHPDLLAEFETRLSRAVQTYPLREDDEFYLESAPLALLRYALLAGGRLLVERGSLNVADDIFFLEWEEALDALRGDPGDLRPSARRRRAERAWIEMHPGPAAYGRRPQPPPPAIGLPREVKENLRVLTTAFELIFAQDHLALGRAADAQQLHGIPASAGTYTGIARVIIDESQFGKIQAGDVLVCPTTSPVWSVLFPSVGALVTDAGGVLSHPAIIAREYGIPAVVATGNATERVRDGDRVSVNGLSGVVEVLR